MWVCAWLLPRPPSSSSLLGLFHSYSRYNPVANPAAVVVSGSVRFTILTSQVWPFAHLEHFCNGCSLRLQLIRLEQSGSSGFEDRRTVAFLNRFVLLTRHKTQRLSNTDNSFFQLPFSHALISEIFPCHRSRRTPPLGCSPLQRPILSSHIPLVPPSPNVGLTMRREVQFNYCDGSWRCLLFVVTRTARHGKSFRNDSHA